MLYPESYVLGNASFATVGAAIFAGLGWTVLVWNAMPLAGALKLKEDDKIKMPLFYLAVNFVVLWVIARFSAIFGFGVASYVWVFYLAFVANIVQWIGWYVSSEKETKKK